MLLCPPPGNPQKHTLNVAVHLQHIDPTDSTVAVVLAMTEPDSSVRRRTVLSSLSVADLKRHTKLIREAGVPLNSDDDKAVISAGQRLPPPTNYQHTDTTGGLLQPDTLLQQHAPSPQGKEGRRGITGPSFLTDTSRWHGCTVWLFFLCKPHFQIQVGSPLTVCSY